ncbi:MAG: glycine--tRNA ligase subunit beta, partial [Thiotrichales bacterium]|nr:glycine--tRNA ligase subunit beta [Thiotrichales bacterium]
MSNVRDLIIELGTEELPAAGLESMAREFCNNICAGLEKSDLKFSSGNYYATPRRLAVHIHDLVEMQEDRVETRRGPALEQAFDAAGKPSKAASGFASSCNVDIDQLETIETGKGKWVGVTLTIKGRETIALLGDILENAVSGIPLKKRMRWGVNDFEFVRPLHWITVVFGKETVELELYNIRSGNRTYGHRFLAGDAITIKSATDYQTQLRKQGRVIADFSERRSEIERQVDKLAKELGGTVCENRALLNEVTGLVEWPVALAGNFDPAFLDLPREVLVATMEKHQKSFAVQDASAKLLPHFISVSNLESTQPEQVVRGNEKVLQPRLSDAAFFWQRDTSQSLEHHGKRLSGILYQETLGSMADKSDRISRLAVSLAGKLQLDTKTAGRAACLCKNDLVTDMVGEFPGLQGIMGQHYAAQAGEEAAICAAIGEHYRPAYAGDRLPDSDYGQVVAIADKLDTLTGIFSIGQAPSGDRDPFGLRRSALGVLRILIEKQLDLDLPACLRESAAIYSHEFDRDSVSEQVFSFIMDRLKKYYLDKNIDTHI